MGVPLARVYHDEAHRVEDAGRSDRQARPQVNGPAAGRDPFGNTFGSDNRRAPGRYTVGEWSTERKPKILPDLARALGRFVRGGTAVGAIITPTPLGDGTNPVTVEPNSDGFTDREALERDGIGYFTPEEGPEVETSVYAPRYERTPRTGDIIVYPSDEPDPYVPVEMPFVLPETEIDTVPVRPAELPQLDPELDPAISPQRRPLPARPEVEAAPFPEPVPEVELHIEFSPEGAMRIRQRTRPKNAWSKRRRDSKTFKVWLLANQVLSRTIGTVDEIRQFVDAVVWNAYAQVNGVNVPAMSLVHSRMAVVSGIADGSYELDVAGALVDYAFGQAVDRVIGRASSYAQDQFNQAGWSSPFGWQVGPADTGGYFGVPI